jgi:hypothetical protein
LIGEINDAPAREHFLASYLEDARFVNTVLGYQMRRTKPLIVSATDSAADSEEEDAPEIQETA